MSNNLLSGFLLIFVVAVSACVGGIGGGGPQDVLNTQCAAVEKGDAQAYANTIYRYEVPGYGGNRVQGLAVQDLLNQVKVVNCKQSITHSQDLSIGLSKEAVFAKGVKTYTREQVAKTLEVSTTDPLLGYILPYTATEIAFTSVDVNLKLKSLETGMEGTFEKQNLTFTFFKFDKEGWKLSITPGVGSEWAMHNDIGAGIIKNAFGQRQKGTSLRTPFEVNAWGYKGWGPCTDQDFDRQLADNFCKSQGYSSTASGNACLHEWGYDRWRPVNADKLEKKEPTGSGLAWTEVICAP